MAPQNKHKQLRDSDQDTDTDSENESFLDTTANWPRFQAVAVRVTLNKVITFCSIYVPPSDHVAKTDLINIIKQLPSPFVLLGDFKIHSPVWGKESYNSRAQMLEDLFSEMDLCILNDGSATYIHPTTGSTSPLDLSICGPSLVLDYEWNIHEDLCLTGGILKRQTWCPSKLSVLPN